MAHRFSRRVASEVFGRDSSFFFIDFGGAENSFELQSPSNPVRRPVGLGHPEATSRAVIGASPFSLLLLYADDAGGVT